jgi:peptidoglycan/xylan/chitin deacetylase (PgdA/CDA1 family)
VSDLSGNAWKVQLEQSRETLRKASGQSVQHFAYPYGIISAKAFPHLSKSGYKTAFQLQAKKLDRAAPLYTCAAPSSSPPGAAPLCSGT